jgi:hypothetical protein
MTPRRKELINGVKIEEYYWAGDYPCYVDNLLSKDSYNITKELLLSGKKPNLVTAPRRNNEDCC